jgi:putative membrane-bound dehydrogenase-like protein
MSFDEDGLLYVVEMRDYSERRPERLGRIRRLEDVDGDGHFDRSTIFAADLPWPTAVICYGGGIFVGCTPDILWIRDLDGDGVGDEREVIFTGFAADFAPFATNRLNVQALMNSFNWTLDDRIHGASSFSGGKVRLADSAFVRAWLSRGGPTALKPPRRKPANISYGPEASADDFKRTLELRGRDFSFDPRRLEMRAESGGGQHGLSFDDAGRKFVCANSSHIENLTYEERYATLNPAFALPRALVEIAVDGGAAPVFRLSPDEPWRVLRTQWRVAGLVPGPIEGGGKPSGYFTGATGVTIYRGDAYGDDFAGNAFIGDAGGNLVHRKKIYRDEAGALKAVRPADEQNAEFLASTDNWFRPVQFANAPDGCLYICDMYREVIEHPWSLPQSLKKHLDLNSGNDRGRIYRIVPEKFRQPRAFRLSRMSSRELVEMLERPNGWHRDTAARLLYERQDPAAVSALKKLQTYSPAARTRMHAIYALAGQSMLGLTEISRGLSDVSAEVRRHTIRLSERLLTNGPSIQAITSKLVKLARDPELSVRRQLSFTAGVLPAEPRTRIIEALFENDSLIGYSDALFHSLGDQAAFVFHRLVVRDPSLGRPALADLARIIGVRHQREEVAAVMEALAGALAKPDKSPVPRAHLLHVAEAFARGLEQGGQSIRQVDVANRLSPLFTLARDCLTESKAGQEFNADSVRLVRLNAISFLGAATYEEAAAPLLTALDSHPDDARYVLAAFARCAGARTAPEMLQRWPRMTPSIRGEAVTLLLKRPASTREVLSAIQSGSMPLNELSPAQRSFLRDHPDAAIREQAAQLFGRSSTNSRQSVIDSYLPALSLKGASSNGRKIFQARCASCHKLGNEGYALGPDLVSVRNAGKEKLLTNLIDPNRELNGNFAAYSIETRDGETLSGIVAGESGAGVTVRMAGGIETVLPRNAIVSLQNQNRSLMPEGLEEGLSPQEMADLLEFVLTGPSSIK